QTRGFDQFSGHEPAARLLAERGARVNVKADLACTLIGAALFRLQADIAQQTGQQRHVQLFVGRFTLIQAPALFTHQRGQLTVHVAPFAQAQRRQKILPQQRHELALGRLVRHLLSIPTPQLQIRKKLGPLVVELGVRLISRFALLHRTVTRILYGQSRGDDEHFAQTLLITGRQYHAAHTRINRQPGLLAPHGGKAIVLVERTELLQLLVAVGNGPTRRCVDEWKGLDVIELERLHAQNHGRQRRAPHLGIGKGGARLEIGLVVKPYADARTHAPATSGTLIGGCLADGLDAQLLNLVAPRIAFHARQAAIDDVTDTRNGERRFGHVRGQHDAPRVALGPEDALLFRLREPRVQRKHLRSRRVVLAQGLDRFADLTLARKEDQHIARTVAGTFVDALDHRIDQVTLLVAAAAAPA